MVRPGLRKGGIWTPQPLVAAERLKMRRRRLSPVQALRWLAAFEVPASGATGRLPGASEVDSVELSMRWTDYDEGGSSAPLLGALTHRAEVRERHGLRGGCLGFQSSRFASDWSSAAKEGSRELK